MVRTDIVRFEGFLDTNDDGAIVVKDEYGIEGGVEEHLYHLLDYRLKKRLGGNSADLRWSPFVKITIEVVDPA